MKKFDEKYVLLDEMYQDDYYPKFLVEKVKKLIEEVIAYLETGETNELKIQEKLNEMTRGINELQDEFDENDSEIETSARELIAATVEYILKWFEVNIDIETAIQERDW